MKKQLLSVAILGASMIPVVSMAEGQTTLPDYGFIENAGQVIDQDHHANPQVKFLLNTPGLNLQLRNGGFSYDAYTFTSAGATLAELRKDPTKMAGTYHYHRVDVTLVGSNRDAAILAGNGATDYINYYNTGNGTIAAHHYGKVTYKDIYPNIDLEFVTTAGQAIEYNFIIRPGGDPGQIKLQYNGTDKLALEDNTIAMTLSTGIMHEKMPASYTLPAQSPVNVTYKAVGNNTFAYQAGDYDRTKTLIIDPVPDVAWATYFGGSSDEVGRDMAVSGTYMYIGGFTQSTTNIATTGAFQSTIAAGVDGFFAKFNTAGVRQWGSYFGANGNDYILGIGVSSGGDICITGQTTSTSGIATSGAHQQFHGGGSDPNDGFLAKFNAAGARQWASYYGGTEIEYVTDAAFDGNGDIYICGTTGSFSGIATSPSVQSANAGIADGFLAKFSGSGTRQWATYAGGNTLDEANSIAVDGSGNVFLCGTTNNPSSTYLLTSGAHQTFYGGGTFDYFLAKYSTSNGARAWGTFYGGSGDESRMEGSRIATDPSGDVYMVGGTTSSDNIATSGTMQQSINFGTEDGFIVKFNTSGIRQWATYYGSSAGDDALSSISTDASGNLFVAGFTTSSAGLATVNAYHTTMSGNSDTYFAKFSGSGGLQYSSYCGGTTDEDLYASGNDGNGHIILFGNTNSSSGLSTGGSAQPAMGGGIDAFMARFNVCLGALLGNSTAVTDVSCYGLADGQVTVTVPSGLAPFTFTLGSGTPQVSATFTSLAAGTYTINIVDDNGCKGAASATVAQPVQLQHPVINGSLATEISKTETYTTSQQLPGVTYTWTATGGSILNGQGTNQVQVLWSSYGAGSVKVAVTSGGCTDSGTIAPVVNWRTGVSDVDAQNQVAVYPNPATDNINITLQHIPQQGNIQMFDNVGNLVMQQPAQKQQTLNISQLPAGIYYLKVENSYHKISKL